MPAKKKTVAKEPASAKKAAAKGTSASKRPTTPKPGDLIVIESEKVGTPPREGEVLEVVQGQVSVSYRVRWQDGHQSVIAPGAGNTSIIPTRRKR
jgi:Domain of unknown function (DUF1918)